MTDTTELIERLRNSNWSGNVTDDITRWADSRSEAATALETLQAENEQLRSAVGRLLEWWLEGSENGRQAQQKGVGFSDDLVAARAALTGDSQNG